MVICLERGAGCLHMVQLMPLHPKTPSSLASFKSRLVLSFLVLAYPGVLEKRPQMSEVPVVIYFIFSASLIFAPVCCSKISSSEPICYSQISPSGHHLTA